MHKDVSLMYALKMKVRFSNLFEYEMHSWRKYTIKAGIYCDYIPA